jgi:two-component system nitrogen regulation sensor histidine kinase NtrY
VIVFLATWAGFYVARGVTDPIKELAEATNKVAEGDLDVTISHASNDEIGSLVRSFNKMTSDLQGSRLSTRPTLTCRAQPELEGAALHGNGTRQCDSRGHCHQ